MTECIFCRIVANQAPASIVYQDNCCTAFMDIQPINPGHMLVVPNQHVACLAELDADSGVQLFRVAQRLAAALRSSGVRCEGVNLFLADGEAAGQDVFHVHLHVFPRYKRDGFGLRFSPAYFKRPSRSDLDSLAEQLRDSLLASGIVSK